MKFVKKIVVLVIVLGAAFFIGKHYYEEYRQNMVAQARFEARPAVKKVDGTSISPAFYSNAAFKEKLEKKYPFIANATFNVPQATDLGKNYVVPGLLSTKSYDYETNTIGIAKNMTPQGLTVAGSYILISAYDGEGRYASVIYVLSRKTGEYIKTIVLHGRPHVGGLAYDPIARYVWITGSKDEGARLAAISMDKIEQDNFAKTREPIDYTVDIALPTIQRASTVTYFDNQLFVGFFNVYDKGTIASFTIAREGEQKNTITNDEIKSTTGELTMSFSSGEASISNQIQGIAVTADRIFLTQSYGGSNAKLYIYPISAIGSLSERNAEKVIELPPYLEQVYVSGNQVLLLFESASRSYARDTITIMDRVLAINVNALLNS